MNESDLKSKIQKALQKWGVFSWRAAASQFGRAGVSDILGIYLGRMIALEVKTPEAYRRPNHNATASQLAFLANVREHGGVAHVVCSVEQVRDALRDEGIIIVDQ